MERPIEGTKGGANRARPTAINIVKLDERFKENVINLRVAQSHGATSQFVRYSCMCKPFAPRVALPATKAAARGALLSF